MVYFVHPPRPWLDRQRQSECMPAAPCKIFIADATAGLPELSSAVMPRSWLQNKYAQERYVVRAAEAWRVPSVGEADLVLIATNFSLYCTAKRPYAAKNIWHRILNDSLLCDGECAAAISAMRFAMRLRDEAVFHHDPV